jgi:hypothetical protein
MRIVGPAQYLGRMCALSESANRFPSDRSAERARERWAVGVPAVWAVVETVQRDAVPVKAVSDPPEPQAESPGGYRDSRIFPMHDANTF